MTIGFDDSISPTLSRNMQTSADKTRRLLIVSIGLQLGLALPSLVALVIDDRLINEISVWIKPLKFQASLIVMLGTLLLLLPLIERRVREGRGVWLACMVAAATATGEIAYITLQAARGRASHFNTSTATEALAYSLMGVGAALLVLSSLVIGIYILRRPDRSVQAGLRLGAGWGLILGSILTLITAFVLGSGQIAGPGHWVGGIRSDAGGLFLLGWSRTGGDLRVPHFFATHIMQALPILGLLADCLVAQHARWMILGGALVSIAVVVMTFVQALSGQPFL